MCANINHLIYSINTGVVWQTDPKPLYGFLQPSSFDPVFSDLTFAVDFSGVYFRSNNFDKGDIYRNRYYDVTHRPLLYSPLICYLYNKTFCHLPFPRSALLHLLFQVFLLMIGTLFVYRYYRLDILILPTLVLYAVLIGLTPVGLSWFERGQFDIYPAVAILFFVFGVTESKWYAFVLSALVASLKWNMIPFFVEGFVFYLLFYGDKRRFQFLGVFLGIIAVSVILFPQYMRDYFSILSL
ncbi:MAG: DUF2029 domain-containing protein, partial [Candidatus Omnitrophica bacterium]|nr:DUF2029 domain-containing protein [Candidatus Omnitrophota bacterium]